MRNDHDVSAPLVETWDLEINSFEDRPLTKLDADDVCRLKDVASTLTNHLRSHLNKAGPRRPLRIGLFGGLGQGKTTLLHSVKANLSDEYAKKRTLFDRILRRRRISIQTFDTAMYEHKTLEHEFDRVVAHWGIAGRLMAAGVVFVLLLAALRLLAYFLAGPNEEWINDHAHSFDNASSFLKDILFTRYSALFIVISVFTALFWSPVKPSFALWYRKIQRRLNFFSRPDVLIVDDLDRATIEQQKALLRALYKHSEEMPFAVIVALDEFPIIAAKAETGDTEAFLRKFIHVEYRIPTKLRDDVSPLLCRILDEFISENPALELLSRSALFRGDLARLFSLHQHFGPRKIKRFLNDLFPLLQQLNAKTGSDIGASIRLLGMFELAPKVRYMDDFMISKLEQNGCKELEELAQLLIPASEEKDQNKAKLLFYLKMTRHLQPNYATWRNLVSRSSLSENKNVLSCKELDRSLERICRGYGPGFFDRWRIRYRNSLFGTKDENNENQIVDSINGTQTINDPFATGWPQFEATICAEDSAKGRLRLLHEWLNAIERDKNLGNSAPESDFDAAQSRLFRVWLGDEEVIREMSLESRSLLFKEVFESKTPIPALLTLVPPGLIGFDDRIAVICSPGVLFSRHLPWVDRWLLPRSEIEDHNGLFIPLDPDPSMLGDAWPPFLPNSESLSDRNTFDELCWHLKKLRKLAALGLKFQATGLYNTLFGRKWLVLQCRAGNHELVLKALRFLLFDSADRDAPWRAEGWRNLIISEPNSDLNELLDEIARQRKNKDSIANSLYEAGLAIICLSRATDHYESWIGLSNQFSDLNLLLLLLRNADEDFWSITANLDPAFIPVSKSIQRQSLSDDQALKSMREALERGFPDHITLRDDFWGLAQALKVIPPVPNFHTGFAKQNDSYFRYLQFANHRDIKQRTMVARQLLNRSNNKDIEQINRALFDTILILSKKWDCNAENREWRFVDVTKLNIADIPDDIDSSLRTDIENRLRRTQDCTPKDFDALLASSDRPASGLEEYRDWFYKYTPYLIIDLEPTSEGYGEAENRLMEFVKPVNRPDFKRYIWTHGSKYLMEWKSS